MDLKDVIADVSEKAIEAHNAFHAGHGDVAENNLDEIRLKVAAYFDLTVQLRGDVTESVTSEKPEATLAATPAQGSAAEAHPGGIVPFAENQNQKQASTAEKPNQ